MGWDGVLLHGDDDRLTVVSDCYEMLGGADHVVLRPNTVRPCLVHRVERGYVLERRQLVNAAYRTYHGTRIAPATTIPPAPLPNGYPFEMRMPAHEITWLWSCSEIGGRVECADGMKHFWLEPIIVRPPGQ